MSRTCPVGSTEKGRCNMVIFRRLLKMPGVDAGEGLLQSNRQPSSQKDDSSSERLESVPK